MAAAHVYVLAAILKWLKHILRWLPADTGDQWCSKLGVAGRKHAMGGGRCWRGE